MANPVVLFDGVCNLCNGTVQFVIARDSGAIFRFAPLGSDAAMRLRYANAGAAGPLPDSVALIEDGRLYTRSTAALRIGRRLGFPWWLIYGLIVVPRPLRDMVYDFIARHQVTGGLAGGKVA